MDIFINKLDIVLTWAYYGKHELDECNMCLICKLSLMISTDTSNYKLSKQLVKGICGHIFHKKCYDKLQITNLHDNKCPIDKIPWQPYKIINY